jgi:hypothetical protein
LVFAVPRNDLTGFLLTSGWKVEQATDPAGLELETSPRSTAFVTAVPVD